MSRFEDQYWTWKDLESQYVTRLLDLLRAGSVPKGFVEPYWENYFGEVGRTFSENPDVAFLANCVPVRGTMFVNAWGDWFDHQWDYLSKRFTDRQLRTWLAEDLIGKPEVREVAPGLITSHNSVHHLYHLAQWFDKTLNPGFSSGVDSVVEWGGGYGNLCKVFVRAYQDTNGGNLPTYTIIDAAPFSVLQWLYLSSVLGPEAVNLVGVDGKEIQKGKVNLLALNLLGETWTPHPDLFISTWALSESTQEAQRFVCSGTNWFGARSCLIAYHQETKEFSSSEYLESSMPWEGRFFQEEISYLKDSRHMYAFRGPGPAPEWTPDTKVGLFYNITSQTSGPGKVVQNLVAGLGELEVTVLPNQVGDKTGCLQSGGPEYRNLPEDTLMGPNLFVTPLEHPEVLERYSRFVCPSPWVKEMYENPLVHKDLWEGKTLSVWSVGIDTERFNDRDRDPQVDCLVYLKNRPEEDLRKVEDFLESQGLSWVVLRYGSYSEADLIRATKAVRFAVLVTKTESQGIGYMEILSSGIPCLVWDTPRWAMFKATSTPWFDSRCGVISEWFNADVLWSFVQKVSEFRPREYILENHRLAQSAARWLELTR